MCANDDIDLIHFVVVVVIGNCLHTLHSPTMKWKFKYSALRFSSLTHCDIHFLRDLTVMNEKIPDCSRL